MKLFNLKLAGILFIGLLFLITNPQSVSAQCTGETRCGVKDTFGQCDPEHDFLTGCGGGCNPDGCGGCVIVSSCSGGGATPPPGGGGACNRDYGGVDCPGGFEKSPNILTSECITDRQLLCNQPNPNYPAPNTNYWVGTAQSVGACCAEDDEGGCTSHTLNLHQCVAACPAGTTQQCGLTNMGNYQRYNSCYSPTLCNDSNDVYVPTAYRSAAAGLCYCNCNPEEKRCGRTCDPEDSIYNVVTTCQNMAYSCNCVPSGCTATAPTAPTLLYPNDGGTVTSNSVLLSWSQGSWGTGCPTNNQQFTLYIGINSSANMASAGTIDDSVTSTPLSGLVSGNTYYWRIDASNGSLTTPSITKSFRVDIVSTPWWQVKDGDVTTNGDITSLVPNATLFNIVGLGGYPGVPVYGGAFNLTGTPAKISATVWNANTNTSLSRQFNYSYFENLVPDDVNFNNISNLASGGSAYSDSYHWFKATGNTTISSDVNIGNRKVILFVENGNLTINGKVNLNDGNGFFGAFVEGNITIGNSVTGAPSLEGVYLSNGSFNTGAGTSQLHVRGSVASFGGVNLQRNLSNNSTPAELFEFAPDQMMLFPEKLMFRRNKWTEVAP